MSANADTLKPDNIPVPAYQQYGAVELKSSFQRYMAYGVGLSMAANLLLTLLALLALFLNDRIKEGQKTRVRVVQLNMLQPPPLSKQQQQQVKVETQVAPPSVGIPVAVPDQEATQEQQLASLKDIDAAAQSVGTGGGTGDIVIAAPPSDELPGSGQYVYHDDEPSPIKQVGARYPDMAKSTGIEGKVVVNVLVGTDGKVVKAEIAPGHGVPVLNAAALDAAKQWLFRPALANNKPVAVWVAIPFNFRLNN